MQLCKFMGVTPVEGFEVGERYEYYSAGIDAIRVLGNGMDKTFTIGDFNISFTRIPKNNTTETVELKDRKGLCRRTAMGNNYYTTGDEYYFNYEAGKFFVQCDKPGEEGSFSPDRFYELFTIGEEAYKPEPVDMVNNPPHYKGSNGIESIDVIENFGLNFNTGNAVKYILRAGRKDITKHKEDLQKAIWYLNRELSYLD